jgi:hypothetical protein
MQKAVVVRAPQEGAVAGPVAKGESSISSSFESLPRPTQQQLSWSCQRKFHLQSRLLRPRLLSSPPRPRRPRRHQSAPVTQQERGRVTREPVGPDPVPAAASARASGQERGVQLVPAPAVAMRHPIRPHRHSSFFRRYPLPQASAAIISRRGSMWMRREQLRSSASIRRGTRDTTEN